MSEQNEQSEFDLHPHKEFLELFEKTSFSKTVRKVMHGLRQPKESGAYKYARFQLLRLLSFFSAITVPLIVLLLLSVLAALAPQEQRQYELQYIDPEPLTELPEDPPPPPDPDFQPPVDVRLDMPTDVMMPNVTDPAEVAEFSPQPAAFSSVALTRSPIIMRGIYGTRNPGQRGEAMRRFGAPAGVDAAVLRALRWLKMQQLPDGSWPENKPSMTALAVLTFLANGELPGQSKEFGETLERGIRWLVENQTADGRFTGRDGHEYCQPIAAYALAEAFGLTRVPMVKDAAEKAIAVIIRGQNPSGGFNYNLVPGGMERDDTSYMAWCAQALKAAHMAGLNVSGLMECMKKALAGFRKNFEGNAELGGFGYTSPSITHGLTSSGVLAMQLLGEPNSDEVRGGLVNILTADFTWDGQGKMNRLYYHYYTTQAIFHQGGDAWNTWNRKFAPVILANQTIIKDAYSFEGETFDVGFWQATHQVSGHTDGNDAGPHVMNTIICNLQLQVYYRYLPTFQKPEPLDFGGVTPVDSRDLVVDFAEIGVGL